MDNEVTYMDKTTTKPIKEKTSILVKIKRITYLTIKRIFDILFSLIGLIFCMPITIIIKVSYMLSGDFHSIFYSQERIGKNGKLFKMYKYRTMCIDADEKLEELLKSDSKLRKEYKINKKLANDPRITKVGKHIRKCSVDEFPQFLNVLKGDMSLIGNRPYLPKEMDDMKNYYFDIIKTKPGLSGLWQVSGRSNTTFETRCALEAEYSNSYSLKKDIIIFFKTFLVIFKGL